MTQSLFAAIMLLISSVADTPLPALQAPQVNTPPVIDGRADDAAWQQTPTAPINYLFRGPQGTPEATVQLCYSDEALYALFTCQEPSFQPLQEKLGGHDGQLYWTDCVVLVLAPDPDRPQYCYNLYVSCDGLVRDEFYSPGMDLTWNAHATVAVQHDDKNKQWTLELAIPLTALARCPVPGDQWRANFGRIRHQGPSMQAISWQPTRGAWIEPDRFGELDLPGIADVPVLRKLSDASIRREHHALLEDIKQWHKALPDKPLFALTRQFVSDLDQCAGALRTATVNPEKLLPLIRDAQRKLPREAAVAELIERTGSSLNAIPLSAMVKLRQDELPKLDPASELSMDAARGEAESCQLLLVSAEPIKAVTVTSTSLKQTGGDAAVDLEIQRVGYVPVRQPTPCGDGMPGDWPDPLFDNSPMDLSPQKNGSYLLTCQVPADAAPGDYEGTVTVAGGDQQVQLPIHLHVHDTTLPTISRLKTVFYGDAPTSWHEQLLRYRMTPTVPLPWSQVFSKDDQGQWSADWAALDAEVEHWLTLGATTFAIESVLPSGTHPPAAADEADVAAKLQLTDEHLTAKGWADRFYFYTFDEPNAAAIPGITQSCSFLHRHGPHLQMLMTFFDPAMWMLRDSIDIWVPQNYIFYPYLAQYYQQCNHQLWSYVCIGNTDLSGPDIWKIDCNGAAPRAMSWWLWKYHCEGFLYWATTYWPGNPYDDTVAFPMGNGEGCLLYPDPDAKDPRSPEAHPPFPSLRVVATRDGFEDYDLLALLQDRVQALEAMDVPDAAAQPWLQRAHKCLDADPVIPAMDQYDHDPRTYEQRHRQLLKLLDQAPRPDADQP